MSDVILPFLESSPTATTTDAASIRELISKSTTRLTALAGLSGTAFSFAFVLSPSGYRHPYLFYTSIFCLGAHFTEYATEYVYGKPESVPTTASQRRAAQVQARKDKAAAKRMMASYDVLDDSRSEEGTASGEELSDDEVVVGGAGGDEEQELRAQSDFIKKTMHLRTAVAGVGFIMAVIGIWGDDAYQFPAPVLVADY